MFGGQVSVGQNVRRRGANVRTPLGPGGAAWSLRRVSQSFCGRASITVAAAAAVAVPMFSAAAPGEAWRGSYSTCPLSPTYRRGLL